MPRDYDYQYKMILRNKASKPGNVIGYHEGRGTQEGLFAELITQAAMSYVPCNHWNGNKIFMHCAIFAYNLTRELQMRHLEREPNTITKKPALCKFSQIDTLRKVVIQRAGRQAGSDHVGRQIATLLSFILGPGKFSTLSNPYRKNTTHTSECKQLQISTDR